MSTYYFTIPYKFTREPHPLSIGPNDLIVVSAEHKVAACTKVNETIGNGTWYTAHNSAHPDWPRKRREYYRGRIVGLDGRLVEGIYDATAS